MKEYYKAYDDRYKVYHEKTKKSWAPSYPSTILKDILDKYVLDKKTSKILEVGCGEGQNAMFLMQEGFNIEATDVSHEAIKWCKNEAEKKGLNPLNFYVLDALDNKLTKKYDVIYSISTLHMLVLDKDRINFLKFLYDHLNDNGVAIISVMGDGEMEINNSDIKKSFDLVEREINGGKIKVASTSCRIVNWKTLFSELDTTNLKIVNHFVTDKISGFNSSMVVEVKKN